MTYFNAMKKVLEVNEELEKESVKLRDGLRDLSNYGRTYGGQKCADIAYELLTGVSPDVPKQKDGP